MRASPYIVNFAGGAVPGFTQGLLAGMQGMVPGMKRTIRVPPALGFGDREAVGAPFAVVPPGSTLIYDIEVLRVSYDGPDALVKVPSQRGQAPDRDNST